MVQDRAILTVTDQWFIEGERCQF